MRMNILLGALSLILITTAGIYGVLNWPKEKAQTVMMITPSGGDFEIPSTGGLFKTNEQKGSTLLFFSVSRTVPMYAL